MTVTVRGAAIEDLPAIMTVLDGGLLELDVDVLRDAIDRGDALVAVDDGRVLGALVLVGNEIEAVAVRRNRRDQGIGSALVAAAGDSRGRLVAEFDPRVRPFWESLGFEIESTEDPDRYRGVLEGADGTGGTERQNEGPTDGDCERAE